MGAARRWRARLAGGCVGVVRAIHPSIVWGATQMCERALLRLSCASCEGWRHMRCGAVGDSGDSVAASKLVQASGGGGGHMQGLLSCLRRTWSAESYLSRSGGMWVYDTWESCTGIVKPSRLLHACRTIQGGIKQVKAD